MEIFKQYLLHMEGSSAFHKIVIFQYYYLLTLSLCFIVHLQDPIRW